MATKRKAKPAAQPQTDAAARPSRPSSEVTTTLDVGSLREVVELLEASDITRLVWQKGDERLIIRRQPHGAPVPTYVQPMATPVGLASAAPAAVAPAAPAPAETPAATPVSPAVKPGQVVTSPFVGTFYRSPSPESPSFVEVGSVVRKGQVLCIIEAMKLMNEIEAEIGGKVSEVLVENGEPVEFGQPLFRIEPV